MHGKWQKSDQQMMKNGQKNDAKSIKVDWKMT